PALPKNGLRFRGRSGGSNETLRDIAGASGGDHVELAGDTIHSRHGAVGADVHFVAGELSGRVLGDLIPPRAGEKREYDHERAEHAAADNFHGFRLPPMDDAPQVETMGASMRGQLPHVVPRGPSTGSG